MEYYCDVVSNAIEIQVTDKVSKDFTLEAPLELPPFTRGDPVILKLYLKNVSKADKTLNINEPMKGYILTLHDIHGKLILPLTKENAKVENPTVERLLPPGKIFDSNIDLTNMYDWSKEGRYYLTVMHDVLDEDGQNKLVYSNTVMLSVKSKQIN